MSKSMTVGKRLGFGFSIIVFLGVGLAVYATIALKQLGASLEELANDRMVKVAQFSEVKDNMQSIANYARNAIINPDPRFTTAEKSKIENLRANNSAILKKLDKTVVLPLGRQLLDKIKENRGRYNASIDRAIDMASAGEREDAGEYLIREVRPLQNEVFKSIDDSIAMQRKVADRLSDEAISIVSFSVTTMSAMTLIMAGIGGAIGWLLSRNLRAALGAEPNELKAVVARVADGDLSQVLMAKDGDSVSVLASLARMHSSLIEVVSNVRSNSESVATASSQIAQGNQDLSQRTEEQASALQQTAATMEELNTTVRNNADNALQANELAIGASSIAKEGGDVVARVVSTMQGISDSSQKIGDIIGVIDGIAFQTNILALNAAVEAARAGEQGRGFAVVASEVRSLAQRSAEAAKEIKGLINRSVEQVEQGTVLVAQAGKTMGEIVGSIQRVTSIVAEISSASTEQSTGIAQVGEAVGQMDRVTQQNAALVEESAAAAESLKGQASQLVQAVAVFKLPKEYAAAADSQHPKLSSDVRRTDSRGALGQTIKPSPRSVQTAPAKTTTVSTSPGVRPTTEEWETF